MYRPIILLTTTSQYALRALSYLAGLDEGSTVLGRELSMRVHIPGNYLAKILLTLRKAEILDTTRGKGGGYRLRQPPEDIRLLDVVELFEGDKSRPSCILGVNEECSNVNACPAHEAWSAVKREYLNFLESTTVAAISTRAFGWQASVAHVTNLSNGHAKRQGG